MKANQCKLVATISLCAAIVIPNIASAVAVSGQGTWETTLQGRDLDGNLATFEAYYDTVLDITWLADANFAGIQMTWDDAITWATNLNINGHTGWRLPTVTDTGTPGCNFTFTGSDCGYNADTATGEMAHMYFATLSNLAFYSTSGVSDQPGWGLGNTGPFSNIQPDYYWSGTEYAPNTEDAWFFYFGGGSQLYSDKNDGVFYRPTVYYAWAVHSGDIGASAVPVPAAAWLFSSGLLVLLGFGRKKIK